MYTDLGITMRDFSVGGYIEAAIRSSFENPYKKNSDEYWMFEALIESMREVGKASPNPTVGCVYVKDGMLISRELPENLVLCMEKDMQLAL